MSNKIVFRKKRFGHKEQKYGSAPVKQMTSGLFVLSGDDNEVIKLQARFLTLT